MFSHRIALAVLLVGLLCAPASAGAQAAGGDSVSGEALVVPFDALVTIDAHSGPSGEQPGGAFSANVCPQLLGGGGCTTRNPELGGTVTCLRVEGNRAVMGFYGARREGLFEFVRFVGLVEVVDNGSPGAGRDTLAWQRGVVTVGSGEDVPITNCPASLAGGGEFSGTLPPPPSPADPRYGFLSHVAQDFVVTDAQPVPTSKEECKRDGWHRFGFKNQGACLTSLSR